MIKAAVNVPVGQCLHKSYHWLFKINDIGLTISPWVEQKLISLENKKKCKLKSTYLTEVIVIIGHEVSKLRLQILETQHIKTKKSRINWIDFENSDSVLKWR